MPRSEDAVAVPRMTKRLTYVDANVLIAAFNGRSTTSVAAVGVLRDPQRALLVSDALWLETLPKATFHRQSPEVAFYERLFSAAAKRIPWTKSIVTTALDLAPRYGMSAMDAIHIASALAGGAQEFVTGEGWNKPMFRVRELPVRSLHPRAESTSS